MKSLSLGELIRERSEKCNLFSSPLRSFIATFIDVRGEVAWSELKTTLEKYVGSINPNTLSFHIGVLLEAGFIDKLNIKGQPRYRIMENKSSEIERLVGIDLVRKMKEEIENED